MKEANVYFNGSKRLFKRARVYYIRTITFQSNILPLHGEFWETYPLVLTFPPCSLSMKTFSLLPGLTGCRIHIYKGGRIKVYYFINCLWMDAIPSGSITTTSSFSFKLSTIPLIHLHYKVYCSNHLIQAFSWPFLSSSTIYGHCPFNQHQPLSELWYLFRSSVQILLCHYVPCKFPGNGIRFSICPKGIGLKE